MDKPLTCPVMIGRTRERVVLSSLMDLARSGQGRAALIRGEAGSGNRAFEVHVSNIRSKLGCTSRAQIAVWAIEKGLAKH